MQLICRRSSISFLELSWTIFRDRVWNHFRKKSRCSGFDSRPFFFRFGFVQRIQTQPESHANFAMPICKQIEQRTRRFSLDNTEDSDLEPEPALASPPSEARRVRGCNSPPSLRFSLRHLAVQLCAGK